MKAYKGVVENGVVVIVGGRLPEGTVVTVTVGEGELLRARITNVLKRPRKVRVRLKPTPGLAMQGMAMEGLVQSGPGGILGSDD
ncbi:hypothetical protein [Deinococcus sp. RM]|uniref:hypothetical protein n=1 Tax=Deinococcus sp. RM TaxID=2316359 RepID=UPI001F2A816C|nr:hypothetical protein [Deinococcus sp. RM]